MSYKICTKCGESKELDDFRRNKNLKDGHETQCRDCRKAIGIISDHNPQRRSKRKSWINTNRDLYNGYIKKWQENNPEFYKECLLKHENKNRLNRWFNKIKYRAIQKGFEFDLTIDDIVIPEFCPILNIPMRFSAYKVENRIHEFIDCSPSIDRIDNSKGYIKGNVWIISRLANLMKNKGSFENLYNFSKFFNENIEEVNGKYIFKYNNNIDVGS